MYPEILGLPESPEEELRHQGIVAEHYRQEAARFAIELADTPGSDRQALGLTVWSYRGAAAAIERELRDLPDMPPDHHTSPGFYK